MAGADDFATVSFCAVCVAFFTSALASLFRTNQAATQICCDSCATTDGVSAVQYARWIVLVWLLASWLVSWRHGAHAGFYVLLMTTGIALAFYEEIIMFDNFMVNWFVLPVLVGAAYEVFARLGMASEASAMAATGFSVASMLICMALMWCAFKSASATAPTSTPTVKP